MLAVNDTSEASDEESKIILTQFHDGCNTDDSAFVLTQDAPSFTINSDLVLLDIQSPVDLFTNPAHIQNMCSTKKPIQGHCNSGTMATMKDADFGDTHVYFDSWSIANVLSLYHLGRKFRVSKHAAPATMPTSVP